MRLQNFTWPQIQEYFNRKDLIIIGVGSCECHGTHLPVGTDFIVPDHIINLIEEKIDVLIAPTIPYGASDYFLGYSGTMSMGSENLYKILFKILTDLFDVGAKKFIVINGHGGNIPAIEKVGYDLENKGGIMAIMNWWQMVGYLNPAWSGGHAGGVETAAIAGINSNWVDWQSIEDSDFLDINPNIVSSGLKTVRYKDVEITVPRKVKSISNNGWIGKDHPDNANKEWGIDMLTAVSDYIISFIKEFDKVEI